MKKDSKIHAKKHFGQNFLIDNNLIDKIVNAFDPLESDNLLEIGPGLGALTGRIIHKITSKNQKLNVVEIDRALVAKLQEQYNDDINIISCDILKFDISSLISPDNDTKIRIIGNLPYNISTPILFHLFDKIENIQDMLFMLQLEVVDRITAEPNTKQYGRLTIMTQLLCECSKIFHVPATAFKPMPKVESAILYLKPNLTRWSNLLGSESINDINLAMFNQIVTSAFNQRRKTISNSLKDYINADDLKSLNLAPNLRAENLTIEDYIIIYKFILEKPKK